MSDELMCPSCKTSALSLLTVVDVERWECATCNGVWLDRSALDSLADKLEVPLDELAERGGREAARACPRCKTALRSFAVGDNSLDACAEHGLWFDRSELESTI